MDEIAIQREYYKATVAHYDAWHSDSKEHALALTYLSSFIEHFDIKSVLDIGSGTGRTLLYLKKKHPGIILKGIEPVAELREVAYGKGIHREELIDGNAYEIDSRSCRYDLVCGFAVLHHVRYPHKVIQEMLRVAQKAIFISDSNNFGQGSLFIRYTKQFLNKIGLWQLAVLIKTKGKGYYISKEDGLFYPYSVFNNYQQIKSNCRTIYILNSMDSGINPYKSAPHIVLLGLK